MPIGQKAVRKSLTAASDNSFARMKEMPYFKATHYILFRHTTFSPFRILLLPHNRYIFQSGGEQKDFVFQNTDWHQHSFFNLAIHVSGIVRIYCLLRRLRSISVYEVAEGPKSKYSSCFTHTQRRERDPRMQKLSAHTNQIENEFRGSK